MGVAVAVGGGRGGGRYVGRELCAQRTDLLELHNSTSNKPPGRLLPRLGIVRAAH